MSDLKTYKVLGQIQCDGKKYSPDGRNGPDKISVTPEQAIALGRTGVIDYKVPEKTGNDLEAIVKTQSETIERLTQENIALKEKIQKLEAEQGKPAAEPKKSASAKK